MALSIKQHTPYHIRRQEFSDELSKLNEKLPHRYCLILTNKCNLDCVFCFQERKGRRGALNKDEWLDVVEQLPDYAHVTLTGGEPLVFKGFKEVFNKVTERNTCNVISNGLLLNDDFIELFATSKNFTNLSISIDDIGNLNRDVKEKQWDKLVLNIAKLKDRIQFHKSNALFDVKTVVLDSNADDLFEIYKYVKEVLKADTHSFQFLKGSPVQHADFTFEYNSIHEEYKAYEYKKFSSILRELNKVREYNLKNNVISYTHPDFIDLNTDIKIEDQDNFYLFNLVNHEPKYYKKCNYVWESVHINVEGSVYPCLAIEMGNIKDKSLTEIFFGKTYEKFKQTINKCGTVEACGRCGYLQAS